MVTKNQNTSSLKKCEDDMTNMNHIICCLLRSQQNLTKQKHFFGIANDINTHKWLYASRENKPVLEQQQCISSYVFLLLGVSKEC